MSVELVALGPGMVTLLMFGLLILSLAIGIPVAFALGAVGTGLALLLWGWDACYLVFNQAYAVMDSGILIAIPLFILMGALLEGSGLADALFGMIHKWVGGLPGGLAMGAIIICVAMGAMSGLVGAAAVSLGLIAIPAMLKRGYSKYLTIGTVATGSTLCLLIPPSVAMIFVAFMARMSIGQLFLAGIMPGLLLGALFIIYIFIQAKRHPEQAPPLPPEERATWKEKLTSTTAIIPTLIIIASVLGAIFTGMATPTEAAATGCVGTIIAAVIYRRLTWGMLQKCIFTTIRISAMCMWIIVGAYIFGAVYTALGAPQLIENLICGAGINSWLVLGLTLLFLLLLGMIMDLTAIIIVIVPIVFPLLKELGFNPLWVGVLVVVALMIGTISPPFGYSLFYMKGVCPREISMGDIYKSVLPFIVILLIELGILILFPEITLWLPRLIMGTAIVG